jgi:hypothetical protein
MENDLRRLVIVAVWRAPPLAEALTRPRHHDGHDPGSAARPHLSAFAAASFDVVGVCAYGFFVPDLERAGIRKINPCRTTPTAIRKESAPCSTRIATSRYRLLSRRILA